MILSIFKKTWVLRLSRYNVMISTFKARNRNEALAKAAAIIASLPQQRPDLESKLKRAKYFILECPDLGYQEKIENPFLEATEEESKKKKQLSTEELVQALQLSILRGFVETIPDIIRQAVSTGLSFGSKIMEATVDAMKESVMKQAKINEWLGLISLFLRGKSGSKEKKVEFVEGGEKK